MASSPEAVNEMLVKKSADYAGRPQTFNFDIRSLGKLLMSHTKQHAKKKHCFNFRLIYFHISIN